MRFIPYFKNIVIISGEIPLTTLYISIAYVHFNCEFYEFFKNNFFYRIPLVAASESYLQIIELRQFRKTLFP